MNYWILAVFLCIMPVVHDQEPVLEALEAGKVGQFGSYFAPEVRISIFDSESTYPRNKAVSMIRNFYDAHQIKGFRKIHEGTSRDERSSYLIGSLYSDDSRFRTFIHYKKEGDLPEISEVRIER